MLKNIRYYIIVFAGISLFLLNGTHSMYAQTSGILTPELEHQLGRRFCSDTARGLSEQVQVVVKDTNKFEEWLLRHDTIATKAYAYPSLGIYVLKVKNKWLLRNYLWDSDLILFGDIVSTPLEESAVSNLDLSANHLTKLHHIFPAYNGSGLNVSVKENRIDTLDIDFKNRYTISSFSPTVLSSHATSMATIIAGGGNSFYEGKGGAWGAGITSANFSNLLPEPDTYYQQYGVSVQNHSYGTAIDNAYGPEAMAYDASVISNPSLVHVFSAGNSGTATPANGNYAGLPSVSNLTGRFKMAKNILTVGHTDSSGQVLLPSSRGPAYDGRLKPELVAFGEDGSSGAAAIVSGIALNLQQYYKAQTGTLPSSALIRALLINSADDTGAPGIDFHSGYGTANAFNAMYTLQSGFYYNNTVAQNGVHDFPFFLGPGMGQLKLTLAWNDPPAGLNAAKALVNDLDLELINTTTGDSWKPWVLNSYPQTDSLLQLPKRKRDSLNNAEQITVSDPPAGDYIFRVKGTVVTTASQFFSVAWQTDAADVFTWNYPVQDEQLQGGKVNMLRWSSTFAPATTGNLQYSVDNGSSWQTISNNISLAQGYYRWNAPAVYKTALLRMGISTNQYYTNAFTISQPLQLKVGYHCADSFLLYWNPAVGVSQYRLYQLGNRYMEAFRLLNDTAVVLAKTSNPGLHYAVAPVIGTREGIRSFTIDYTTQGTGCYVRRLFVERSGNTIPVLLELGTDYGIQTITWEKKTLNGFRNLSIINGINGLNYTYTDIDPQPGVNTYRAKIVLRNGTTIYSDEESVYYFKDSPYIIYPNPVSRNQPFFILNDNLAAVRMELFTASGLRVSERPLKTGVNEISVSGLAKGIYWIRLTSETIRRSVHKLVVY